MQRELTYRQQEVLDFMAAHKAPVTIAELARHFGVSSPTIHQRVTALELRGYLSRDAEGRRVLVEGKTDA